MRLSIFGLGYVGCVSSACFSDSGHEVIGVDTNPLKVGIINEGRAQSWSQGSMILSDGR